MANNKFGLIFNNASTGQKIIISTIVIAAICLTLLILNWVNKEELSILYSNLEPGDAGAIVQKLDNLDVKYELRDGNTILVSKDEIYRLRIQLAEEGLPGSKGFGYELMDKNIFGSTDFLQKVNFHRALEGEIARTISTLDPIDNARVHLVIPDPAIFKEDEKPVTAAITVQLKGNNGLTHEQIQSIVYLTSASIEGLLPQNVTVVDTKGNILSSKQFEGDMNTTTGNFSLKIEIEKYLTDKISTMLADVLGSQNAVVRVSADLDMEGYEKSQEKYDPESVVRSELITESSTTFPQSAGEEVTGEPPESSESQITTNYEINKTVEHIVKKPGTINRLTVSVLVNGQYIQEENEAGEVETGYVPRSPDELVEITSIVKNAVGFDEERGDRVTVTQLRFEMPIVLPIFETEEGVGFVLSRDIIEKIFVILLVFIGVFLIKSLLKKYDISKLTSFLIPTTPRRELPRYYATKGLPEPAMRRGITEPVRGIPRTERAIGAEYGYMTPEEQSVSELEKSTEALELEARRREALKRQEEMRAKLEITESLERSLDPEAQKRQQQRKQVGEYVEEKPTQAASILRSWINR
ncbi:MAG: flagellar M-ring protein FliF [Candidatus Cloacimonetes bacterium]|nr:flagellar M-ring protein FliF [Candidatus Cloacimonadota bacterium]